jgi:tRNA threonylcarbamoyl adenosine modification protein YeaZ
MRVLAIAAALGRSSVAVVDGERVLAELVHPGGHGQSAVLASMVQSVFTAGTPDLVAVDIGPGSFTGLRAAISLAQGLAAGAGATLVGVTVAEALAEMVGDIAGRDLWVAIDSRRGRIFLDRAGSIESLAVTGVPLPARPVALAGDAATDIACRLAARGADVMLTAARQPLARHVALAARRQLAACGVLRAVLPVYVDPPEAKLPSGLRPAPLP